MKKSLFATVVFLLVCTSIGYTQEDIDFIESATSYNHYDFDFVGGGTRAKGMGNAFYGVSNDITAGSWNPAGLFELDKTTFGISWFNLAPKGISRTATITDTLSTDHSGSFSDISSIHFISPIRISGHPFVFSANLSRNFNNFLDVSFKQSVEFYNTTITPTVTFVDTNIINFSQRVTQDGGINSLNFGFGTRLYDNISFGATVNIYSGSSVFKVDQRILIDDFRYNVFQLAYLDSSTTIIDTNKFSGANITLGFMHNSEKLDFGLVIKTPFTLKEKRIQGIYAESYINGSPSTIDATFSGDILFKYEMPLMIGAGVGYQVKENWLLAGDIEYRGFSGKKVDERISQTINPGGSNIEEYNTIEPLWNNSFSVRVGTEYMKPLDFGRVPFRAGFAYVPVPGPSVSAVGKISTLVNYSFTAGTGLHLEKINLDIAYVYSTSDSEVGVLNGSFKQKNHTITASFTGVF